MYITRDGHKENPTFFKIQGVQALPLHLARVKVKFSSVKNLHKCLEQGTRA